MDETGNKDDLSSQPPDSHNWPFSRSALTAGLRRFLAAGSLRLLDIQTAPLPRNISLLNSSGTHLRALSVGVTIDGETQRLPLVLKEPPVTHRGRVLRTIGQREYGVYKRIAPHLPLRVPAMIAGDAVEGWIVLEGLVGLRLPQDWTVDDYKEAILNLVAMHERFTGLAEDLALHPWLARPLGDDLPLTRRVAKEAAKNLINEERISQLSGERPVRIMQKMMDEIDTVVAPLKVETPTFIHGDYWPGNIARPVDGPQMIFDWQLAGIGPGLFDLVTFVQSSLMSLETPLSAEAIIGLYRERAKEHKVGSWDDELFACLWDHALMWQFIAKWMIKLATIDQEDYTRIHDLFNKVWLEPVLAAAERRL